MTGDYLLDKFQLAVPQPDVYRIGQYTPVSVKDQIVRANYLIERLWKTKRLRPDTRLLVIGAGAAGVTAAIKALHFKVRRVELVDKRNRALSLQAGCGSRWLDPAQYDWPAPYWAEEKWPIQEPNGFTHPTNKRLASPLNLFAQSADGWASQFDHKLKTYERQRRIKFHKLKDVVDWVPRVGGGYTVEFKDESPASPRPPNSFHDVDVIVFAGGFGQEIVHVPLQPAAGFFVALPQPVFHSVPFWSKDDFEQKDFGLGRPLQYSGVLVSGSGDGALQDFIRLVSGKPSVRSIWLAAEQALTSERRKLLNHFWHWEAHSERSTDFAPEYTSRCDWLAALHARYTHEMHALVRDTKSWPAVKQALDRLIGGPTARPIFHVKLALTGDHFTGCYPLNRWVALLLVEYINEHALRAKRANAAPLLQNVAIREVSPLGNHGKLGPVKVWFATPTTCATTPNDVATWSGKVEDKDFDALIVRHGIDPSTLSIKSTKLRPQAVPPHLP